MYMSTANQDCVCAAVDEADEEGGEAAPDPEPGAWTFRHLIRASSSLSSNIISFSPPSPKAWPYTIHVRCVSARAHSAGAHEADAEAERAENEGQFRYHPRGVG